jgi:DNA polymerase elongation subunit (family B)
MKFDWNYLIERSVVNGIYPQFSQFSKLRNQSAKIKEVNWSSSAYAEQKFNYIDAAGRVNLDVIIEIERNYKFPKYSLDYVSQEFLGETKDDVTPRQLFMLVQLYDTLYETVEKLASDPQKYKYNSKCKKLLHSSIKSILIDRFCSGEAKEMRRKMLEATTFKDLLYEIRNTLTVTGRYNVQDCILPIKLCEKQNLWISVKETSNTFNVPISYLHTRGQGIKVLSLVYREAIAHGYVVPWQRRISDSEKKKYVGAIVADVENPGYYQNVACFDFASLYPTGMISRNVCYTTFLKDNDPTPDEMCHVLEWEDHQGCEHDTSGKNVDKKKVLCQKHRYRFRKLVIHPDGTREYEGIMPRLERNLLKARKVIKNEMELVEAMVAMSRGDATLTDVEEFVLKGWAKVEVGTYTESEIENMLTNIKVLNARQLAVKVAANSGYGILGNQQGAIPLIQGAASVTYIGRTLITETNRYLVERYLGDPENGYKGKVNLVYGDTDSTMVYFTGLDTRESFEYAEEIAPAITYYLKTKIMGVPENFVVTSTTTNEKWTLNKFPRKRISELTDLEKIKVHEYDALPISLTFENLYGKYFILTKKRYCAQVFNREGKCVKETKKGVVLARRDNTRYLRDSYKELINAVMNQQTRQEMMNIITNRVNMLFTRQIPDQHLIIYVSVKSVLSYATKKVIVRKGEEIKEFVNSQGEVIQTNDPLDPRLVYKRIPQVLLTLKMLKRGEEVPPNTRLEFLYLKDNCVRETAMNPNDIRQGDKAEDYTFYMENKSAMGFEVDRLLYIEKQFLEPIKEIMNVKFKGEIVPYIPLKNAFDAEILKLNEYLRSSILGIKTFTRTTQPFEMLDEDGDRQVVGWGVVCRECAEKYPNGCSKHTSLVHRRTYDFKNGTKAEHPIPYAQVNYIISSANQSKQGKKNCIPYGGKLHTIALQYKSQHIINSLQKDGGCAHAFRIGIKRPTQCNEKLVVSTKKKGSTRVVFLKGYESAKKGDIGLLKQIYSETVPSIKKDTMKYFYDVQLLNTKEMISRVPREVITTFTRKDGKFLEDILKYRKGYDMVVEKLKDVFSQLRFFEEAKIRGKGKGKGKGKGNEEMSLSEIVKLDLLK